MDTLVLECPLKDTVEYNKRMSRLYNYISLACFVPELILELKLDVIDLYNLESTV